MENQIWRDGRLGAKRLKTLENETTPLKRLLAEAMLDNAALKVLLRKK
ncbi:hypothetical protein IVA78_28440 [Bradyrhizobium sp. 137]|nr:hypothetical protein [Bradyrhizobium sp. 137]